MLAAGCQPCAMEIAKAAKAAEAWGSRTLEDLRGEAVLEDTGVAFTALRVENGRRMSLVICITGEDQIRRVRSDVKFSDDGVNEDWRTLSLGTVVMRAAAAPGGLAFEPLRAGGDEWLALAMIAALPDSIRMLEQLFGLPS